VICALGQGEQEVWPRMLKGDAICEPIPDAWRNYDDYRSQVWAPLPEIDFSIYDLGRADDLRYDPVSKLSIGACHEAIRSAGLELTREGALSRHGFRIEGIDPSRIGVFMGTGIGGINTTLRTHLYHAMNRTRGELAEAVPENADPAVREGLTRALSKLKLDRRFNPLAVTMLMSNAVAAAPGVRFGATGPCKTTTLACASGTAAIGEAFRAIENGAIDFALAGAAEYLFDEYGSIFRAYDITGALTHGINEPARANRPFDEDRRGFLFSEGGAGVVMLERRRSALQRGVEPLAEVAGFGESFDSYDLIAMDPNGDRILAMLQSVVREAEIQPEDIDYVNAHGTGTPMNDASELEVLFRFLGNRPLVNSTKGLIGHTIGASGAIETVVTARSIQSGRVHPCVNLESPLRNMNFPLTMQEADIGVALTQSFAFGGHNACLVLKHPSYTD
jgi:3-oxoacyl-[acyl-carrier-protein] synthase II